MKVEYTDVSVTEKSLVVEIPSDVVEEQIQRVTTGYARTLKLPGFRPGKVPAKVVRQRFMPQILQDVAEDLIPRAVDDVLRERGVEPVDTPSVKDVSIDEHQPLKFTAAIATAPPVDPGPLDQVQLRKPPVTVADDEVSATVERLRSGRARYEPVEGRGAQHGETVVADMTRRKLAKDGEEAVDPEELQGVSIEIGAEGNPPGFDAEVTGLAAGDQKTFTIGFPEDYPVESLAGSNVQYALTVTGVKSKVLPALDDEFAKDLGYDSIEALRQFVRERLTREAERNQDREIRQELLRQLARRVEGDAPEPLVKREVERRLEEFVHQLAHQGMDPRQMSLDWDKLREGQREVAIETVKCALVLDELSRREGIAVSAEEVDAEIARLAQQHGQNVATVRKRLEKDRAIGRIFTGLRREKTIDYAMSRATVLNI
ncbi:MAG TPA: trigger factor [Croceibacterium sp.]|nr:trigger factor [Croceibacterium sp.]